MGACGGKQNPADTDYDHEQNMENFKIDRKPIAGPMASIAVAGKNPVAIDLKKALSKGI